MEGDDSDIQAWRQVRLCDEPIYCAAPTPSDPADIIYVASDDELDESAKVTKRLRYEEEGLRYLRGKPLNILSASLRGPFDEASGWQNPWLPKTSNKNPRSKASRRPENVLSVVKQNVNKDLDLDAVSRAGGTTPEADNSMQCHLPSPQSTRELQLFGTPLETEKRIRIQAWAQDLPPRALVKDEFWAPNQSLHGQNGEASRKRPAGKQWLKRQSLKRMRPNNSQNTAAVSTPTPVLPMQPFLRSASAPTTAHHKASIAAITSASRSFEMTTPSSNADRKNVESSRKDSLEASTRCETTLSGDGFSRDNRAVSSDESISAVSHPTKAIVHNNKTLEPLATDNKAQEHAAGGSQAGSKTITVLKKDKVHQPGDNEGAEGNTSFESFLDQSFRYRARPPKHDSPPLAVPDNAAAGDCMELTQTGTPESSKHEDAVVVSSASPKEHQTLPTMTEGALEQSCLKAELSALTEYSRPVYDMIEQPIVGEAKLVAERLMSVKDFDPVQLARGGLSIMPEVDITSDAKYDGSANMASTTKCGDLYQQSVPNTPLEVKMGQHDALQGQPEAIRENTVGPELFMDEGSTLVSDPMEMDVDQPSEGEAAKSTASPTCSKDASVMVTQAGIASPTDGEDERMASHEASDVDPDGTTEPRATSQSQVQVTVQHISRDMPTKPGATIEAELTTSVVKVEEVPGDCDEGVPCTLEEPIETIERRSPWISDILPTIHLGIEHVKSEPIEDEPSPLPCPININLVSSQVSSCEPPQVRPSQQSPWAREIAEQIIMVHEQCSPPVTIPLEPHPTEPVSATREVRQSPWTETSEHTMSSIPPRASPTSPISRNCSPTMHHSQAARSVSAFEQRQPLEVLSPNHSTPSAPKDRDSTPDPELSIKSFAKFNTPSPKRRSIPHVQRSSVGQLRGILAGATPLNPWGSTKLSRRVSFAPPPDENDDATNVPPSSVPSSVPRAASPPPRMTIEAGDEDIGDQFQNHFDAMKRRIHGETVPRLRLHPRLLPSSSQQRPMSPAIDAMAEAFQAADAQQAVRSTSMDEDIEAFEDTSHLVQSPWQTHSQGADDVADVMGNLDEFLGAWDVDADLDQARVESERAEQDRRRSRKEIDPLSGIDIWS